jgi:elongation factor Ts
LKIENYSIQFSIFNLQFSINETGGHKTLDISAVTVKELREKTGAGVMDCKRALQDANGDMEKAAEALRQKGLTRHAKLAGRAANQGLIESYIHTGGRIGALVELNCETDFVARTDEFRTLAREIAMQVASMDPKSVGAISDEEAGEDESALLNQSYIRDPSKTIRDLVRETIGKVGENIQVSRFSRFEVGMSGAGQDGTGPVEG